MSKRPQQARRQPPPPRQEPLPPSPVLKTVMPEKRQRHYSARAAEVGFDLKTSGHLILLPRDIEEVEYEMDGDPHVATGSRNDIIAELELAGYKVSKEVL
jgi:hypothetical protein